MDTYKKASRILIFVLISNIFIATMKLAVGYLTKSESITADGLHSFTDSTSNIIGLVGMKIASKPADLNHPYGHKKFESLAGLFIGVMLIVVTFKILYGAIEWFFRPHTIKITNASLFVMIATLIINITVATIEYRKAKKYNSDILLSDSMNTRSDIFVTTGVLLSIIAIRLGAPMIIDPIFSVLVAGVIIYASIHIFKRTAAVLVDESVLDPVKIKEVILSFLEVKYVDKIRSRGRNDEVFIELHLKIDPNMNINSSHRLHHQIESKLSETFKAKIQLIAHFEPSDR